MPNIKTFPVTVGYDHSAEIGKISLDVDKLPTRAAYCFAIMGSVGYMHYEPDAKSKRGARVVLDDFELTEVSLIPDKDYYTYLYEGLPIGFTTEDDLPRKAQ